MKIPKPERLPSGSYRIRLRLDGESISITKPTEQEAIREAELVKAQHRNGLKARPSGGNVSLNDAIEEYIVAREGVLSPSTIRGYRIIQRTRFQREMNRPLARIKWQAAISRESAEGVAPKTIKNTVGFIRSVYKENGVEFQPVTLPAMEVKEKPFLEPEQIPAFIKACHGNDYEIGILLGLSGLRRSEIYGLEWEDVDLDKNQLHVHHSVVMDTNQKAVEKNTTKNRTSTRRIPIMIPELRDALSADQQDSGPVVKANLNTLNTVVNRICKRNGFPQVGLHGLRHSFASLCYSVGVPELQCMRLGGWSDYGTMRRIYTHLAAVDNEKADDKLALFFKNAHENAHGNEKVSNIKA